MQLLIGVLFVLIAASVSPSDVSAVLAGPLALVAIMVLVIRPLAVALAPGARASPARARIRRMDGAPRDRGRLDGIRLRARAQPAPRPGRRQILPIVFVVIFATVVVYGLTAGRWWRGCSASRAPAAGWC